jgi:hypothetical protein
MLHYDHRRVSSFNMPIFRRKNFIITASGIVTLEIDYFLKIYINFNIYK